MREWKAAPRGIWRAICGFGVWRGFRAKIMNGIIRNKELTNALKYVLFLTLLLTFLNWIAPDVDVVLWFVGFQIFIGLVNIIYGIFRLAFPKFTNSWNDPARLALKRGVGLILFSIVLWIIFFR